MVRPSPAGRCAGTMAASARSSACTRGPPIRGAASAGAFSRRSRLWRGARASRASCWRRVTVMPRPGGCTSAAGSSAAAPCSTIRTRATRCSTPRRSIRQEAGLVSDLTKLTLAQARDGLAKKDFSSVELTQAFLEAIEAGNRALNAYVLVTGEHALSQAKASDARLAPSRRGRWKACRSASRTSIARRACAPRPAPTSWASSRRPMNRR